MAKITKRLAHGWNAFLDQGNARDITSGWDYGQSYGGRPDRTRLRIVNERSIISSIYTRLSIDVASVDIRHVRLDENDRYKEDVKSGLNWCLTVEANIDQAGRQFRQDIAWSLFNEGAIAIVPVDSTSDPAFSDWDVKTLRVGNITGYFPSHVKVNLYNEKTGRREELMLAKHSVAIVENPLYSVMNEPNSTLQRLTRKLHLLDAADDRTSAGKLDIIIQNPYPVRSEMAKNRAEERRQSLEDQLKSSAHGIGQIDATDKIIQLNRPIENGLLTQIQSLKDQLYAELGLTPEIMSGTADEKTMLNYINRTIEPVLGAIAEAMKRSFLSKTAITQKQDIQYFRDPFKLTPMSDLAEMVDKFTRNEVFSSNEIRTFLGVKPSDDPRADQLLNSNMAPNPAALGELPPEEGGEIIEEEEDYDPFDDLDAQIDKILGSSIDDDEEPPDE